MVKYHRTLRASHRAVCSPCQSVQRSHPARLGLFSELTSSRSRRHLFSCGKTRQTPHLFRIKFQMSLKPCSIGFNGILSFGAKRMAQRVRRHSFGNFILLSLAVLYGNTDTICMEFVKIKNCNKTVRN